MLNCISAESNCKVPTCHQVQHLGFVHVASPEERDSGKAQQGQPRFSLWAARLLFPAESQWCCCWRGCGGSGGWRLARCTSIVLMLRLVCHTPVTLPCPSLHQNSLVEWHSRALLQTPSSMEGVSKGSWETDVQLMQTQILLMSSVGLNQFYQQKKFLFFPRPRMVTCSLAHPYPAWVLSFAPRNMFPVFSERDGEGPREELRAQSWSTKDSAVD